MCGKARLFLAKVLVSPNNKLIASGGQDGLSNIEHWQHGLAHHQPQLNPNTLNSISFSGEYACMRMINVIQPCSDFFLLIYFTCIAEDKLLRIWKFPEGDLLGECAQTGKSMHVAFRQPLALGACALVAHAFCCVFMLVSPFYAVLGLA